MTHARARARAHTHTHTHTLDTHMASGVRIDGERKTEMGRGSRVDGDKERCLFLVTLE